MLDTEVNKTTTEEKPKKNRGTKHRNKKETREEICTHEGHPLTASEAQFIDEYIRTGNIKKSYETAYANFNPKTSAQLGQRVFNKAYIASEIKFRLEQARDDSIADATEIMKYFTEVMRGNIKDQFGLEASLSERTKAAQELAKRQIDIPNRLAGNEQPEVRIVLDWKRGDTDEQTT